MSNCIVGAVLCANGYQQAILDPEHFNYHSLQIRKDTDGNSIYLDDCVFILRMAQLTTHREWRNFLWEHVQPHVRVANLFINWPIRDEYDNYESVCRGKIRFQPPGTLRSAENYSKLW